MKFVWAGFLFAGRPGAWERRWDLFQKLILTHLGQDFIFNLWQSSYALSENKLPSRDSGIPFYPQIFKTPLFI